jgi:hypothetical protein
MFGWSFAARTADEMTRLIRAMGKHRYLADVDLRLHFVVDRALGPFEPRFATARERFKSLTNLATELELDSRDPRLWRASDAEEVCAVLELLWGTDVRGARAREGLERELRRAGFAPCDHAPFAADLEDPPHPELILLDWVLLSVDALDAERHLGALRAMEDSGDEVDASQPCFVEGPPLAEPELCAIDRGLLPEEPIFWADGPYSYCDYLFRGVSRAAQLPDPPSGYRDVDNL